MTAPHVPARQTSTAGRDRAVRTTAALGAVGLLAALTAGILLLSGAGSEWARGFALAGLLGAVFAGAAAVLAQKERTRAICGIAAFCLLVTCSTIFGVSFG